MSLDNVKVGGAGIFQDPNTADANDTDAAFEVGGRIPVPGTIFEDQRRLMTYLFAGLLLKGLNADKLDGYHASYFQPQCDFLTTLCDTYGSLAALATALEAIIQLDNLAAPDDNTDLNASTSKHGLLPKLSGTSTEFLAGDGTWGTPAGTGDVSAASNITDNAVVRGDGGAKGVQDSVVLLDDSNNFTEATSYGMAEQAAKPLTVSAGKGLVYVKNDAPNTLHFVDDTDDDTAILLGKNNLSDVESDDAAISNLVSGATSRTPILTDNIPFLDVGTNGGKTTPQGIFDLLTSLTNEASPAYGDQLALYDTSAGATDSITISTLFGEGKSVTLQYTGTGVSGNTVSLVGINRASFIVISRRTTTSQAVNLIHADGATGTQIRRSFSTGATGSDVSLDGPAAGTSQTLTINNTKTDDNASGVTYTLSVIGTPI